MPLEIFPEITAKQAREDRIYVRLWVARVLFFLCVLLLVAVATKAYAEEIPVHVHEQDGLTIRLMPGPCVDANSVAFLAEPQYVKRARALESVWRMQSGETRSFAGCWLELSAAEAGQAAFFLVFEDGDRYLVPKSQFGKKSGPEA